MTDEENPNGALPIGVVPAEADVAQFILELIGDPNRRAIIQVPVNITDQEILSLIRGSLDVTDVLRANRPKEGGLVKAPPGLRIQH